MNELRELPDEIRLVFDKLDAAGGRGWLVGGTTRDMLRGVVSTDFDLATDLRPEQLVELFPAADFRDRQLGACCLKDLPWPTVLTTLRRESDYVDHRHPRRVEFVDDPVIDAQRRDFTVNAIYLDPVRGEVLDPFDGRADLQNGVLRAIGDPQVRFEEDALRLLRALRFTALLGAAMAPATREAANRCAGLLEHLSATRVYEELTRTFTGANRGAALRQFVELGFAAVLMPEVAAMQGVEQPPEYHPEGCVLTHVCLVLDHVSEGSPLQAWSAVLHDIGKPPTFHRAADRIRFHGHDRLSANMARVVLDRLSAPPDLRDGVIDICQQHIRFASLMEMRPHRRESWMRDPLFAEHLEFHRADCMGCHADLSLYEAARVALAALPPVHASPLRGADVIGLGVPAGPMVGELLRGAQARLESAGSGPWSREQALEVLAQLVARRIKTS